MTKKFIRVLVIAVFSMAFYSMDAVAQDPHFSQYYANPLYMNPAMAGTPVCPRLIMNYRNQWPSISGQYVTYNASYDQHVDALSGGIGVLVNVDRAGEGTLSTTMASGIYSYKLDIGRKFSLKAGIQATFLQKSLDWEKLTFGDQIDPRHGFVFNTNEVYPSDGLVKTFADFSAGMVGYSERFYAGFAVHHLTTPNEGFISYSELPMKYTVHAGAIISIEGDNSRKRTIEETSLSPNIMFQKQQEFEQLNYGLYLNKFPFVGGVWYRHNFDNSDAVIVLLGFQQQVFKFGYSYDLTVSKLTNASGGAHEFSLTIQFECSPKRKRIRAINCPSF
ncbi:MAG: type IX secretion system membrane protein PorP/SprF [Bacteroidales bacterium]|nr:type IX secretion system membrane protein PorP/SprF [Bacteroidales bacterium]